MYWSFSSIYRRMNRRNALFHAWKIRRKTGNLIDPNDLYERSFWGEYMQAYEEAIQSTACQDSPWYIIPADDKPYSRVVIADAVCQHLASLNLEYPTLSEEVQSNLQSYIEQLQNE